METSVATKSNVQLIQDAFTDFLSGNIPGIINICADDIVWGSYKNPDIPFAGNFFGKEGVMEFFKGVSENINYFAFEPREYVSQDDVVAAFGHHAGTVKSTGKSFDHDWCMRFKLSEGKVQNYFCFADSLDQAKSFK